MLAVVGHVERAWGYSFMWDRAGEQLTTFESALLGLLADKPIGYALEYFNDRYAEISSDLTVMIEDLNFGGKVDDRLFEPATERRAVDQVHVSRPSINNGVPLQFPALTP